MVVIIYNKYRKYNSRKISQKHLFYARQIHTSRFLKLFLLILFKSIYGKTVGIILFTRLDDANKVGVQWSNYMNDVSVKC